MARIFKVKELEAKRRALTAESEVYRQTLRLEIENLRLAAMRARRQMKSFQSVNPLLTLVAPMAASLLTKRRGRLRGLFTTALLGWQVYRKAASFFGGFAFRPRRHSPKPASRGEERSPAAEI